MKVNEEKIREMARLGYRERGKEYEDYIRKINVNREKSTEELFDIILNEIEIEKLRMKKK